MSSVNLLNSQIDVTTVVSNLMYIERAPVRTMQSQLSKIQSKVSAYQSLNTKLSALSSKVNTLLYGETTAPYVQPYTFQDRLAKSAFSKYSVQSSDDAVVTATASNADAPGIYAITVGNLAQAQVSASAGFASNSTILGTGTIKITAGSESSTVTIDSSNNTLVGVAGAINRANAGVTATIINDGSGATPYRLMLTADDTGTKNAFSIESTLAGGAALSFGAPVQAAEDAEFTVNGIAVTQSSNTISEVISGATFTLKDETAAPVTLTLGRDTEAVVAAIKEMVTAYNAVNSFIGAQFKYNETTESAGALAGDPTLRSVQSRLQSQFTQSIRNRYTNYGVTGQVGLEFNRDGSLSLDEEDFNKALEDNFTAVAALFLGDGTDVGSGTASDSRVSYVGKTAATEAGSYAVEVTALAEQAAAAGSEVVAALAQDETLTIQYGSLSATVNLLQNDDLAAILSKVNAGLSAQGIAATAEDDGAGRLRIRTNGYGSAESISVVSSLASGVGTTGFGTTPVVDTGGDIAGTIGGNAATGAGLVLTGGVGNPEEGLSARIAQTVVGSYGSIVIASATEGTEGSSVLMNLFTALKGLTDSMSGPIKNATDGLNSSIKNINDSIKAFEDRLLVREELLTREFSAADQALKLLSMSQSSLSSQLSTL